MKKNTIIILFLSLLTSISFANAQEIIENKTFEKGLHLKGKKNIIIRNCNISNPNGTHCLFLDECENITIENCHIKSAGNDTNYDIDKRTGDFNPDYIFCTFVNHGVYIKNSKHVKIMNSEIMDTMGQGIRVHGSDNTRTSDITIEGCRICYTYDDGIKFSIDKDQEPAENAPFKGGVIRNNVLHDIGLGMTRLPFARHGMYLKTADVLVEGNTIYNCFYGSGISLRNAGIIRNNKIFNCVYACIAYHTQTITEESSKTVVIEGNECRQEFGFEIPMRHVSFPEKPFNKCGKGILYIGANHGDKTSKTFIGKFVVKNNKFTIYKDYPTEYAGEPIPMAFFGGHLKDVTLEVENNTFTDERPETYYIKGISAPNNKFE